MARARPLAPRLTPRRLRALVEEAIVDAYDESEQRVGFLSVLEENLACPFMTELLGLPVQVDRVTFNDAEEIVAVCHRGRQHQQISLVDLPLPDPPPDGWEWIVAYRYWARGQR